MDFRRPFYDPSGTWRDIQDELGDALERVWQGAVPQSLVPPALRMPLIDVYEFPDRYEVHADTPGISSDAIDVSYLNRVLTLRGTRTAAIKEGGEARIIRHERRCGTFSRSIDLPVEINEAGITAESRNGVLIVNLPKLARATARTVRVDVRND